MKIILAEPRGFCAGVERAIKIVDKALSVYPDKTIYVFHEIVHNAHILCDLKRRGVQFIESIDADSIPNDSVLIFSAHGVQQCIVNDAKRRIAVVIDATCPLVTKVHREVQRNDKNGKEVILIGHQNHQEVIGIMGQIDAEMKLVQSTRDVETLIIRDPNNVSYVTQTTLSIDDTSKIIVRLRDKFPKIQGQNLRDICYATQNRQNAVKNLAQSVDIILVLGSKNSSNSNRLTEIGISHNIPSYLIDNPDCIDLAWFEGVDTIGITAGASAPEILVSNIISFLKDKFKEIQVTTMDGLVENVTFKLPNI